MFERILVATDGSPLSEHAAEAALRFACEACGSIVILSVAEPSDDSPLSDGIDGVLTIEESGLFQAARHVGIVVRRALKLGVHYETVITHADEPSEEIINTAMAYRCNAIFIGAYGRAGPARERFGSQAQKVLETSCVPVLVFRGNTQ